MLHGQIMPWSLLWLLVCYVCVFIKDLFRLFSCLFFLRIFLFFFLLSCVFVDCSIFASRVAPHYYLTSFGSNDPHGDSRLRGRRFVFFFLHFPFPFPFFSFHFRVSCCTIVPCLLPTCCVARNYALRPVPPCAISDSGGPCHRILVGVVWEVFGN